MVYSASLSNRKTINVFGHWLVPFLSQHIDQAPVRGQSREFPNLFIWSNRLDTHCSHTMRRPIHVHTVSDMHCRFIRCYRLQHNTHYMYSQHSIYYIRYYMHQMCMCVVVGQSAATSSTIHSFSSTRSESIVNTQPERKYTFVYA